jgi:hypothetical protein
MVSSCNAEMLANVRVVVWAVSADPEQHELQSVCSIIIIMSAACRLQDTTMQSHAKCMLCVECYAQMT